MSPKAHSFHGTSHCILWVLINVSGRVSSLWYHTEEFHCPKTSRRAFFNGVTFIRLKWFSVNVRHFPNLISLCSFWCLLAWWPCGCPCLCGHERRSHLGFSGRPDPGCRLGKGVPLGSCPRTRQGDSDSALLHSPFQFSAPSLILRLS